MIKEPVLQLIYPVRNKLIYILIVFAFWGCAEKEEDKNFNAILKKAPYSAVMFIAPDCPLCMTLSKPYLNLKEEYSDVQFLVVHSGEHYDPMELNMFANKTGLKTNVYRDRDYTVAHQFGATITPEFLLVDSAGNVLYQGLLDDRMADIGVKKQTWSKSYLGDALNAISKNEAIEIQKTEAIGCVLEY